MDTISRPRIGILGGTFNPIHMGHLILAQTALETHDLAKVLFMPCATPSHKQVTGLISARDRMAMVQAAIGGNLAFEPCEEEIRRGGVSYAVDTIAQLRLVYPDSDLFFVIGLDTLLELHLWKQIYTILPLCRFVTFARPGIDMAALTPDALRLRPPWPERLLGDLTTGRRIDISSSDIRHRLAEGMGIRYLVPLAVEVYIAEHRLYAT